MRWTHAWAGGTVTVMKLYFSPLACSLASRIALYETGTAAELVEVDPKTKKTSDGRSFLDVHPLGLVPVLETDDGALLSENAAILQMLARGTAVGATSDDERARLQQWLGFVATELHKAVYVPLLDAKAPKEAKAYALSKAATRLAWVESNLATREFLLDRFTVADAYLFTVLNWSIVTPVSLEPYPAIRAYQKRVRARPHVDRAFGEERILYAKELARHAATSVIDFVTGGASVDMR
jgi:glutathione S-transferase